MTDKALMTRRFSRSVKTYDGFAAVQDAIADRMMSLLAPVLSGCGHWPGDCGPSFPGRVLEIGCGTGLFTRKFLDRYCPEKLWLNDICPDYAEVLSDILGGGAVFLHGDAEKIPFPEVDLVVSCSALQWFHDLPSFFRKAAGALPEGGILAFSTFGKDNMREIAAIEGASLHYWSLDEIKGMLPEGVELLYAGEETVTKYFDSAMSVLRHLKGTGVTGIRKEFWTRERLMAFGRKYAALFAAADGQLPLTYHPIWVVCRVRRQ